MLLVAVLLFQTSMVNNCPVTLQQTPVDGNLTWDFQEGDFSIQPQSTGQPIGLCNIESIPGAEVYAPNNGNLQQFNPEQFDWIEFNLPQLEQQYGTNNGPQPYTWQNPYPANQIALTPEPPTWLLQSGGLLLIGAKLFRMRLRRRKRPEAPCRDSD
jgi:hypothetical protein